MVQMPRRLVSARYIMGHIGSGWTLRFEFTSQPRRKRLSVRSLSIHLFFLERSLINQRRNLRVKPQRFTTIGPLCLLGLPWCFPPLFVELFLPTHPHFMSAGCATRTRLPVIPVVPRMVPASMPANPGPSCLLGYGFSWLHNIVEWRLY